MKKPQEMNLDELENYFSDYHKDFYGYRPFILHESRGCLLERIASVDKALEAAKSTEEGLNALRMDGWNV